MLHEAPIPPEESTQSIQNVQCEVNLLSLPADILRLIVQFIDKKKRKIILQVCNFFRNFNYREVIIYAKLKKYSREGFLHGWMKKLTSATLSYSYMDDLPSGIKFEELEILRNVPIGDMMLILELKRLRLGPSFKSDFSFIANFENLEVLELADHFDGSFTNFANLRTLKVLIFTDNFDNPLSGLEKLSSLEILHFKCHYSQNLYCLSNLINLKELVFNTWCSGKRLGEALERLPNLQILDLTGIWSNVDISNLINLRRLSINDSCKSKVTKLINLEILHWQNRRIPLEDISHMKKLKELHINNLYKFPITGFSHLSHLEYLHLGRFYDHPLGDISNLTKLRYLNLGVEYNHPLVGISNAINLTHLILGFHFDQPLENLSKLKHLQLLRLSDRMTHPIYGIHKGVKIENKLSHNNITIELT